MNDVTTGMPAAGWYSDRPDATALRWWDGAAWTDNWHEVEPTITAPAPDPATRRGARMASSTESSYSSVAVLERTDPSPRGVGASIAAVAATAAANATSAAIPAVDYIERQHAAPRLSAVETVNLAGAAAPLRRDAAALKHSASFELPAQSSQTFAAWLLALSPIWIAAGAFAALTQVAQWAPSIAQTLPSWWIATIPQLLVGLLALVLLLALAGSDSSRLRNRGLSAPSPWWAVLTPIYFVRRVATVGRASLALVLVHLLAIVALAAAVMFFSTQTTLLSTVAPAAAAATDDTVVAAEPLPALTDAERAEQLTDTGVEAKLRTDLEKTWGVGAVDCQPFPSTAALVTTTCVVELDGVTYNAGLQVTPSEPSVAFVLTGMLPADQ